jgi:hypothetical protein
MARLGGYTSIQIIGDFTDALRKKIDRTHGKVVDIEVYGTIADMAIWPWYGGLVKEWLYDAAEFLSAQGYVNVVRWADQIFARPAVARGRKVNRTSGTPAS